MQIPIIPAILLAFGNKFSLTSSFSTSYATRAIRKSNKQSNNCSCNRSRRDFSVYSIKNDGMASRRDVLQQSSMIIGATTASACSILPQNAQASTDADNTQNMKVFKTDSGLRYIELEEGSVGDSSKTPKYGQLCVISYTGYLQLPKDNKLNKFASQSGFVTKHGNGRLIAGLDEGLHTMKRGGRRRLIIPPKLGFVTDGLGPVPEMPWQRETLNRLLNEMIAQRGGNLIYDVQLERFFDDEADQGYYQDDEISPEELAELNRRLNNKNSAIDSVGESINIMERDRDRPIV